MGKRLGRALGFAVLLAVVIVGSACNKNTDAVGQGGDGGGPPPGMGGGRGGPRGPIREVMTKLFKGPQSLKESIGRELSSDSPTWDTIQPQTKEFAELASTLSKYDPPKGSKESWTKLTTSFSERAMAMDRAAAAKNKSDALSAYTAISDSCKSCHEAHRGGRGGMGPPGPAPGGQPQN